MEMRNYSWDEKFPSLKPHTSIAFLQRCDGFYDAKHGDIDAARRVVHCCVKQNRKFEGAVALPVISQNQLPMALAECMSIPICTTVKELPQSRKSMTACERLVNRPCFEGRVQQNVKYVLVDDIVTQGGTLSELRRFVLEHGGEVVGVNVLAISTCSARIAPKASRIQDVERRFGAQQIRSVLASNQIGKPSELTNSEVEYLLRFKELRNLQTKLEAAKRLKKRR